MNCTIKLVALPLLTLALVLCLRAADAHEPIDTQVASQYDSGGDDSDNAPISQGFAKKVAGTYVDDGEFPDIGVTFVGTVTINSDGTMRATNSNCCGADVNPNNESNLQSPGQGNWKRTGEQQITISAITFVQPFVPDDSDCPLGSLVEDGVLAAHPNLVVDFDEDFEAATATFMTDIFLLRQDFDEDGILDYLDPDGVPLVTFPGTDQWTRLPIQE